MTNIDEIGQLTLYEYELLMTGVLLRKEDENEQIHRLAWLNRQVESVKRDGKTPQYRQYNDFYKSKEKKVKKHQLSKEDIELLKIANL
ncbi:hypothetical protein AB6M97_10230 [Streptococcus hillyeri]|uniref:Uncharacterized protein n=1 Tax=Streptococcus hillyeri TaxID=2282420 RepID=A0A3L9DSQ8_9STRE|nr:hypothetical protein [Streptococcus hillyeri]RLY03073.1 hypothetical protein EAF07_05905 [Streptococcus hillyeri]